MNLGIALFWSHVGPYHLARYEGLRSVLPSARLVELADNNTTYGWERGGGEIGVVNTLFPGVMAEGLSGIRVFFAMRVYLDSCGVRVLYVPSFWPFYTFSAALAAASVGCRIVFMTESHWASGRNSGVLLLIKKFLLQLYDSSLVGGSLHRKYVEMLGMPKSRIFDGYDVIDNDYFEIAADKARKEQDVLRQRHELPDHYFLSLGRFVEKKNLLMLIKAYARLVNSGRACDCDMVFVGSGVMEAGMVKQAAECGLTVVFHGKLGGQKEVIQGSVGRVHFYPFAQIDTVPAFYALATAFVLASTTEEWGLVVNEAMASGCPTLVSTAVGCAPDLVDDGKTGYLFDPRDIDGLSDRMARLCGDYEHARELGLAAQVKIADWSCERFGRNALLAAQAALGENALPRTVI